MAINPHKQAAKKFVEYGTFNRPGSEKSGCQQYWNMLLGELLGQTELESVIRYEVPVQLKGSTKYLDAWIPSTRVLIEQKSRGVKLDAPHGVLTSSVHMAWMRTVCGRLEMRYRYSAAIVYNNFPWPDGVPGGHALPTTSRDFAKTNNPQGACPHVLR